VTINDLNPNDAAWFPSFQRGWQRTLTFAGTNSVVLGTQEEMRTWLGVAVDQDDWHDAHYWYGRLCALRWLEKQAGKNS